MMLKSAIREASYRIAPNWSRGVDARLWTTKQARLLVEQCRQCSSLEEIVDLALQSPWFRPIQKRAEILGLLEELSRLKPRRVCEIGGASGGTLFLFCRVVAPDARLISIDMGYNASYAAGFERFAEREQQVTCLSADSHDVATAQLVRNWLRGDLLDFLFIDGDHSFDGVAADYRLYSRLVRRGGLIAFHDIVPDGRMRTGESTGPCVGEVPHFWASLKATCPGAIEFVEHREQDGFGIGAVYRDITAVS